MLSQAKNMWRKKGVEHLPIKWGKGSILWISHIQIFVICSLLIQVNPNYLHHLSLSSPHAILCWSLGFPISLYSPFHYLLMHLCTTITTEPTHPTNTNSLIYNRSLETCTCIESQVFLGQKSPKLIGIPWELFASSKVKGGTGHEPACWALCRTFSTFEIWKRSSYQSAAGKNQQIIW